MDANGGRSLPGGAVLRAEIAAAASRLGFDAVGVAHPDAIAAAGPRLDMFLALGRHGDMSWMARPRRRHPRALWPEARSVIMLGLNYAPGHDPLAILSRRDRGAVSVYARGRDYHDLIKKRLKLLAGDIHQRTGAPVRVFVDTAPLMEKPLAHAAGIGWQGKHTNLVSREHGSWLFLGAILTAQELPPDPPQADHCGSCRMCLDICPTGAFPAPYQLDARRCISYLTIEHKGHIPEPLRRPMGNRIYGCDDCLAVCPWNRFARAAREASFADHAGTRAPPLETLAALDDAGFRALYAGSPIKRTGRERFVRNVLIAIGNSGTPALASAARARLDDTSVLVRAMAIWACRQLLENAEFTALRTRRMPAERDPAAVAEWRRPAPSSQAMPAPPAPVSP